MVSGKKREGSVRTCQRKEERKGERKERKGNPGAAKSGWIRRTWSESRVRDKRLSGLTLQHVGPGVAVCNHTLIIDPRRRPKRELPTRSGASLSRLRFLVWWMSTVRFRRKGPTPVVNQKGMCCCSSEAYGVTESKHPGPLPQTARQHNDNNNNLQDCTLAGKPKGLDKNQGRFVARGSALLRRLQESVNCLSLRKWEFAVRLDSFTHLKRLHQAEIPSKRTWNIRSYHKRVKCLGVRDKEYLRSCHTGDPGTVEGIGKPVLCESGAEGGQRRGDKAPDNQGRQWWSANGSNSESGDEQGQCKGQHGNDSNTTPDATTTSTVHQRSFDIFSSRRKKVSKSSEGIRRSISIDQSRSDDVFFKLTKYRDKSSNREVKTDAISSSSEDPAADLKLALRARPSKSTDRRRSGTSRRNEAGHKRTGGEHSRSRRRQTKKVERSPSSRSSSSSRSGSATRARAMGGLNFMSASRVKRNKSPKEAPETPFPNDDKCKDDTAEFLRKLDSVLTDLVESEKKRISSFGQPSVSNSKEEEPQLKRTSKKKNHKHKHKKASKEERQHTEEEASPALQQLRATLKTVRVRKRPTPQSADVLDTHPECFTDKQPHNPRILKTQNGSQLVTHRSYQPPRRRKQRTQQYPPDFCSSDEDKAAVGGACQDAPQKDYFDDKNTNDKREQTKGFHKEDEEDTCYGSDYHGPQGQAVRKPAPSPSHVTQRLMEAVDSGDHSVDSAYTGSRGATPESILYPSVKPRRTGSSLTTPSTGARPRPSRFARCSPKAERLQQLKRNILNEIRENGLYSDESINSLLDQYRRRYCQFSSAELDLVTRSIQEDLGVKPRAVEYLYQILVASEDDQSPSGASNINVATATDSVGVPPRKVPSPVKLGEFQEQHEVREEQKTYQRIQPTLTHNNNEGCSFLGRGEAEDEAWAKTVLKDVAPQLVQEAKEEARGRQDESDPECASYVTDLCHQLHLNI